MKPAGGIRTAKQALHFLIAVKETLGDAWLTTRALSLRRELAAQRSAAPDREGKDRRVPGALLLQRSGGELLMPTDKPIASLRNESREHG